VIASHSGYFEGPVFDESRRFVSSGPIRDFSPGLSPREVATVVPPAFEALRVDPSDGGHELAITAAEDCAGQLCAQVAIVDYSKGETGLVVVSLDGTNVVSERTTPSVTTVAGEEGVRRLYGIALADPEVVAVAGSRFAVSADATSFSAATGACSSEERTPHRCLMGTIFTPRLAIHVYADLTAATLISWDVETAA